MAINISIPDVGPNLHPQITVLGVGGSGGNAVNNMMNSNLEGVDFLVANTDAQALQYSKCKNKIQLGNQSTKGLGAGMRPDIGKQSAEEAINEISEKLEGSHMIFIAAGMGGGTGTGAAPVIAKLAREKGILTVGVVTKPFHFEGTQRMKLANKGIEELQQHVDTLLTIPNQNLFRIANEKTTFADAFKMADDVLYAGVRGVTDLMVQPGLINLDFSDIKNVMSEMGKAMMGTGQHSGERRAVLAAEAAIANPLIDDVSLKGARGLIINITGGNDLTLYEVDEAANRIKQEVDDNANIIYGTTCDERLEDVVRVSIVATGIDSAILTNSKPALESVEAPSLSIDNSVYVNNSSISNNDTMNNRGLDNENNLETHNINTKISSDINLDDQIHENNNEQVFTEPELEHSELKNHQNPESKDDDSGEILGNYNSKISEDDLENYENHENQVKNEELTSLNQSDSEELEPKTGVRKLSLFDTLDEASSVNSVKEVVEDVKSEPVLENMNTGHESISEENNHDLEPKSEENNHDLEPKSEENNHDLEPNVDDEDYNQDKEKDEDLLDIPTFLRRQAN